MRNQNAATKEKRKVARLQKQVEILTEEKNTFEEQKQSVVSSLERMKVYSLETKAENDFLLSALKKAKSDVQTMALFCVALMAVGAVLAWQVSVQQKQLSIPGVKKLIEDAKKK